MGFLVLSVCIWTAGFVIVKLLDLASGGSISETLSQHHVVLHLGCVYFSTNRLNAFIESLARRYLWFFRRWFSLGVVLGCFGLVFSVFALFVSPIAATGIEPLGHVGLPGFADQVDSFGGPVVAFQETQGSRGEGPTDIRTVAGPVGPVMQQSVHSATKARDMPPQRSDTTTYFVDRRESNLDQVPFAVRAISGNSNEIGQARHSPIVSVAQPNRYHVNSVAPHDGGLEAGLGGRLGGVGAGTFKKQLDSQHNLPHVHFQGLPPVFAPGHLDASLRRRANRTALLTPLLPGVTIPASDIGYIAVAILVSAIVHELGHALAACAFEAKVESVGGILLLIFPGAYVSLTGVRSLSPYRQLKVWCAGALHNVALAFVCWTSIPCLPWLLIAFYGRGGGAMIVSLSEESPLASHIQPGDIIKNFGRFSVSDGGMSFRRTLGDLVETGDSAGFCISESAFRKYAHPASACCDLPGTELEPGPARGQASSNRRRSLQCFSLSDGVHVGEKRSCMSPSVVASRGICRVSSDCGKFVEDQPESEKNHANAAGTLGGLEPEKCFVAILRGDQKLLDIRVVSASSGKVNHFFFQGHPRQLGEGVSVSSYIPRYMWALPGWFGRTLARWDLPNILERQLQYVVSISVALGILNMAPVYYLDGEAATKLFLRSLIPSLEPFRLTVWTGRLLTAGTSLLVLNILIALIN